uniref:Chorein N-terminal domain-containing protein n=1 Tax=Clytia hemisphaerica TaxID=252671 RepID=A0A7M5WJD9_9CNID
HSPFYGELNLPVTFLSGKIHKLQLHVPWTRLIYEPVVVTIKTMEFIIKLNDSGAQAEPEKTDVETENQTQNKMDQTTTPSEDLPPGYVQSLLNKVVNNICFKVENVIIKYVEDDIVFSLNAKSVDYFCVDSDWKAAFIDLVQPELLLRRMCTITDLTICLDQRTTSGKIDLYQDPVLYKCSLTSRIVMRHRSVNSTKPIEQKFDVSCESLDFSLADLQIPMVLRLIKLVIGLFYGTLDLPGCNFKKHSAPIAIEKQKNASNKSLVALTESKEISANDSWSSWAWSMLPVASDGPSEQSFEENITSFGLFIKQVNLTLKRTSFLPNMLSGQRIEFSPVMGFELNGCNLNFTSIGDSIVNVNLGLKMLTGFLFGKNCLCAMDGIKVAEISEDSNLE